jgi:hypothetical protein
MTLFLRAVFLYILLGYIELHAIQTLILMNGKNVKGTITDQDDEEVYFKHEDGSIEHIKRSAILKIVFKDIEKEEADRIRKEEEEKKLKIKAKVNLDKKKAEEERAKELVEKRRKEFLANQLKLDEENKKKLEREELLKKQKEEEANARLKANAESKKLVESNSQTDSISRSSVVWRSLLFPGWGQIYAGGEHRKKGILLLGMGTFSILGVAATEYSVSKHLNDYQSIEQERTLSAFTSTTVFPSLDPNLAATIGNQLQFDPYDNKLDRLVQQRNLAWSVFGLVWGYSLFDSFRIPLNFLPKISGTNILPILRPNLFPEQTGSESFYGLSIQFRLE